MSGCKTSSINQQKPQNSLDWYPKSIRFCSTHIPFRLLKSGQHTNKPDKICRKNFGIPKNQSPIKQWKYWSSDDDNQMTSLPLNDPATCDDDIQMFFDPINNGCLNSVVQFDDQDSVSTDSETNEFSDDYI